MVFDDVVFEETINKLNNIQSIMEDNRDIVKKVIGNVTSDWQSEASTVLCNNMNESLEVFQSYIGQFQKIIAYVSQSLEKMNQAESANITSISSMSN